MTQWYVLHHNTNNDQHETADAFMGVEERQNIFFK